MKNLLFKEIRLASLPLVFIFLAFSLMTFIPGYPILIGAFFLSLALFQSAQNARENNDILYTVLLPVKKADTVKAKYVFTVFIQMIFFLLSLIFTMLRMTLMGHAEVYVMNAMQNANQAYLAYILIFFALFNGIFWPGFFRTAYKLGKPFVVFAIAGFLWIGITETIHHFPGMEILNATDTMGSLPLWGLLAGACVIYCLVTWFSMKKSVKLFEKVDM